MMEYQNMPSGYIPEDESMSLAEAVAEFGDEVPDWDYKEVPDWNYESEDSISLEELKERTKEMGDEPFIMTVPLNYENAGE